MSKIQQQNGMMPGSGTMPDDDDFSDGESTPLTQDYGDRYIHIRKIYIKIRKKRMHSKKNRKYCFNII